jgi:hypothetical protein
MVMKTARKLTKSATRTATDIATSVAGKMMSDMTARVTKQVAGSMVGKVAEHIASARYPESSTEMKVDVRKIALLIEEINHEGGPVSKRPVKKGAIAAVVRNPFAGRYVKDVQHFMDLLKPLGFEMADRLIKALGGPKKVEGYGKAIIVGVNGESEHAALWHVPGGYGMRELLDNSKAIVPSTIKVAPAGTVIDVPIHHRTAAYVRSHFDSVEVRVPDAPRPDEIVFILAMTVGGRVHERMGGMKVGDISKLDGQR